MQRRLDRKRIRIPQIAADIIVRLKTIVIWTAPILPMALNISRYNLLHNFTAPTGIHRLHLLFQVLHFRPLAKAYSKANYETIFRLLEAMSAKH
jgi:hypothetical protein